MFSFDSIEPRRWSAADVAAWVQWARRQLQLPSVPLESFNIDGATLASLTEDDFCQRAPQVSILNIFILYFIKFFAELVHCNLVNSFGLAPTQLLAIPNGLLSLSLGA